MIFSGNPLISQDWKLFNYKNSGLPQFGGPVIAIDSSGVKWISTWYGLIKVENYNWTKYNKYNSGLPSKNLSSISIDRLNQKWISSDSGLVLFNDTTWMVFNAKNACIYKNSADRIYFDNIGNIWMNSYPKIIKYDGKSWSKIETPSPGMYCMKQESNGTYWFGTDSGLVRQNEDTTIIYTMKNSGLPYYWVLCMYFDPDGTKWFGTNKGLVKFDGVNWTVFNTKNSGIGNDNIYSITRDKLNNLWLGGACATKFDGTNWTDLNSVLPFSFAAEYCLTIDKNNQKWMGGGDQYSDKILIYREGGIVNDFSPVEELNIEFSPAGLACSPNPIFGEGRIIVDLQKNEKVSITIYDLFGREVLNVLKNEFLDSGTHGIYFSSASLPVGYYNCVVHYNNRYETIKIVKISE